jgi:hypothetical protein
MKALILAAALALPAPLAAQEEVSPGAGAVVRGLDKISGEVIELEIANGGNARLGRIVVSVEDCRFPTGNPVGDAFAHVTVRSDGAEAPIFAGWMIASSPALNALDHSRYDIWVLRCITS